MSFNQPFDFSMNASVLSLRALIHEFTRFKIGLSMERLSNENSPTPELYSIKQSIVIDKHLCNQLKIYVLRIWTWERTVYGKEFYHESAK